MAANETVNIETASTRLVYENRWMRVREDTIRRRDGSTGIYGVVEACDFVVIVPVEDDGDRGTRGPARRPGVTAMPASTGWLRNLLPDRRKRLDYRGSP